MSIINRKRLSEDSGRAAKKHQGHSIEITQKLIAIQDAFKIFQQLKTEHQTILPKPNRIKFPSGKLLSTLSDLAASVINSNGVLDDVSLSLFAQELEKHSGLFTSQHLRQLQNTVLHLQNNAALRTLLADDIVCHPRLEKLINVTLGKPVNNDVSAADVKRAIVLCLFFDLRQGSKEPNCYAIAPLNAHLHNHPEKVIEILVGLLKTGAFEGKDILFLLQSRVSFALPVFAMKENSTLLNSLHVIRLVRNILNVPSHEASHDLSVSEYIGDLLRDPEEVFYAKLFIQSCYQNPLQQLLLTIIQFQAINEEDNEYSASSFFKIDNEKIVYPIKDHFFSNFLDEMRNRIAKHSMELLADPEVNDFLFIYISKLREVLFLSDNLEDRYFIIPSKLKKLETFAQSQEEFASLLEAAYQEFSHPGAKLKRTYHLLEKIVRSQTLEHIFAKLLHIVNQTESKKKKSQDYFVAGELALKQHGGMPENHPFSVFGLKAKEWKMTKKKLAPIEELIEPLFDHLSSLPLPLNLMTISMGGHAFILTPQTFSKVWTKGGKASRALFQNKIIEPANRLQEKIIQPEHFNQYLDFWLSPDQINTIKKVAMKPSQLLLAAMQFVDMEEKKECSLDFWHHMQSIQLELNDLMSVISSACPLHSLSLEDQQKILTALFEKFPLGGRASSLAFTLRKLLSSYQINVEEHLLEEELCRVADMPYVYEIADLNYMEVDKENPKHRRLGIGYNFLTKKMDFLKRTNIEDVPYWILKNVTLLELHYSKS